MNTWRIVLKPKTRLTELHDGQQLFGFLCQQYLFTYGESSLETWLAKLKQQETVLMLSSIMPNDAVFMPLVSLQYATIEGLKQARREGMVKALKKVKYVHKDLLKEIMDSEYKGDYIAAKLREAKWQVQEDLLTFKEEDSYRYDVAIHIRNNLTERKTELYNIKAYEFSQKSRFHFYIQSDDENVLALFKKMSVIGVGKHKRVGLNTYEVTDIEAVNLPEAKSYVACSKYVPSTLDDEIHTEASAFKIAYIKTSPNTGDTMKHVDTVDAFSALTEGSYLITQKALIGDLKLRPNASQALKKDIYYLGIPMLYPLEVS